VYIIGFECFYILYSCIVWHYGHIFDECTLHDYAEFVSLSLNNHYCMCYLYMTVMECFIFHSFLLYVASQLAHRLLNMLI